MGQLGTFFIQDGVAVLALERASLRSLLSSLVCLPTVLPTQIALRRPSVDITVWEEAGRT
eukprot:scaffold18099_cov112-Isochrysis_galbana.AAC.11